MQSARLGHALATIHETSHRHRSAAPTSAAAADSSHDASLHQRHALLPAHRWATPRRQPARSTASAAPLQSRSTAIADRHSTTRGTHNAAQRSAPQRTSSRRTALQRPRQQPIVGRAPHRTPRHPPSLVARRNCTHDCSNCTRTNKQCITRPPPRTAHAPQARHGTVGVASRRARRPHETRATVTSHHVIDANQNLHRRAARHPKHLETVFSSCTTRVPGKDNDRQQRIALLVLDFTPPPPRRSP